MKEESFSLQPFPSGSGASDITITGAIRRNDSKIDISYTISGDLQDIVLPPTADTQIRKHAIWKETCFEAFLAPEGSDHYWEVNLSPAGHWNSYCFKAYREGMEEESNVSGIPISVERNDSALTLSANIDMDNLISPEESIHVGISAVIKSKSGSLSYWALTHTGPEPDFHNRESFILRIFRKRVQ